MHITEFFDDHTNNNEPNLFHPKSLWTPPTDRDDALNAFRNAIKSDLLTTKPKHIRDNLPNAKRRALRKHKHKLDIVIKSADKVSASIIMGQSMVLRWMLPAT